MQKQLYRCFIILGCFLTTTLSGCKIAIPAEIGEVVVNLGARISLRAMNELIRDKWEDYQRSKLPFQLQQGEAYEKIETEQHEYYVVHRLSGITEHYAPDGKLLWSSTKSTVISQDEELSRLNLSKSIEPTNIDTNTNNVYPELNFPDFPAPTYRKFTDSELLTQIDSEYHAGMDISPDEYQYISFSNYA